MLAGPALSSPRRNPRRGRPAYSASVRMRHGPVAPASIRRRLALVTRRICASLLLLGLVWQSVASALACTLAVPAGHGGHDAMPTQAYAHEHQAHVGARPTDAAQASDPTSPTGLCNWHHRGHCPHGAAFHPCSSDQATGLQTADPVLAAAPEPLLFRFTPRLASLPVSTPTVTGRAHAPDLPPPRAI